MDTGSIKTNINNIVGEIAIKDTFVIKSRPTVPEFC